MNMLLTHSYCKLAWESEQDNLHKLYHDHEYGYAIEDDNRLFGRLLLEINQAGLSWMTILKKKENFQSAYDDFDIKRIANYSEKDRERLLSDAGIIRNKLKVNAAIHNANAVLTLQEEHGSFKEWLDTHLGKTKNEWVKLFKKHFKFTGGEITNEFLMSTGYLEGAHDENCPIYHKIKETQPIWQLKNNNG